MEVPNKWMDIHGKLHTYESSWGGNKPSKALDDKWELKKKHPEWFCNCVNPKLVDRHSQVHKKPSPEDTYKYCTVCKKERL